MRAKHKNDLCCIAYSTFSVQRKRQLQITFPRLESECFKDAFILYKQPVDRLADNTIIDIIA